MDPIICTHCHKPVELTEALRHQFEEKIIKAEKEKNKAEIEKLKIELEEKAAKSAKEDLEFKMKDSQNALDEQREKNRELNNQLLELNKTIRELTDKYQNLALENEKKLNKERKEMIENITKTAEEKARLEITELKHKLEATEKSLSEAQLKAKSGSQQLQGEVLELDLEQQLVDAFPNDEVLPVKKGVQGGDILQRVKNKFEQDAGSILWETKRSKDWKKDWPATLRENQRQAGATLGVLVSDVLPKGTQAFELIGNVLITSYRYAVPLANILRASLFNEARAKSAAANKDETLEELYKYLTDNTFKHRFESQVESILTIKADYELEQRATVTRWKKRDVQLSRMMNNLAALYGELQGIVGPALSGIQSLEEIPGHAEKKALPDRNGKNSNDNNAETLF